MNGMTTRICMGISSLAWGIAEGVSLVRGNMDAAVEIANCIIIWSIGQIILGAIFVDDECD